MQCAALHSPNEYHRVGANTTAEVSRIRFLNSSRHKDSYRKRWFYVWLLLVIQLGCGDGAELRIKIRMRGVLLVPVTSCVFAQLLSLQSLGWGCTAVWQLHKWSFPTSDACVPSAQFDLWPQHPPLGEIELLLSVSLSTRSPACMLQFAKTLSHLQQRSVSHFVPAGFNFQG